MIKLAPDSASFGPPDTVPRALGRLRVALDDAYARAGREVGLTAQQAELLCAALVPAPVGEIAGFLRCDRSNVSRLVDRAARRGLVRRSESDEDGRVSMIELSPAGKRLALRFVEKLEAQLAGLLAEWPAGRQLEAVTMLNEIADALDEARRQPERPPRSR